MNPNQLSGLTDSQIRDMKTSFKRFAANWNIDPHGSALKMYLACGVDSAMHRLDVEYVPDEEWENFYQRVVAA